MKKSLMLFILMSPTLLSRSVNAVSVRTTWDGMQILPIWEKSWPTILGLSPSEILVLISILIIIFIAIRELLCWYWKINFRIKTQENILKTLEDILKELRQVKQNDQKWNENIISADKINNEREVILNSEFKETIETNKFII